MKHIALLTTLLLSASLQAVEKPYDYVFFENSLMKGDYFYSQAKYTSPSWIKMRGASSSGCRLCRFYARQFLGAYLCIRSRWRLV